MARTDPQDRDLYVRCVLDHYRHLPGTLGQVRRTDQRLAHQLHEGGVPLSLVDAAFTLATCRRLLRPADAQPLGLVRTMHYYLPVIEELREHPLDPDYLRYLQAKLATVPTATPSAALIPSIPRRR